MITKSSNLATNLLIEHLGAEKIRKTVADLGGEGMLVLRGVEDIKAFEAGQSNRTTAKALLILMEAIARREAVSPAASQAMIDVLARGGRYTCSGAIAGPMVDLDLRTLYLRDLTFHGCTITSTSVFPDLVGYIERGEILPMLAASYPLEQLKDAQQAFIDKRHVGNIVVTMS
jgi:D-arabinose 1-dehydrogenase-like Zn-dependent alcohol dehydrogenase